MKKFEMPQIEVQTFAVADIVTTSGGEEGGNPNCPYETERG